MDNICPRFKKYLASQKHAKAKPEERLTFPSKSNSTECSFARRLNYHNAVSPENYFDNYTTEMKGNFNVPANPIAFQNGVRKRTLEKYLMDLNRRELLNEHSSRVDDTMDFFTEYSSNFGGNVSNGNLSGKGTINMQTFNYPLYGTNQTVFYGDGTCINSKNTYASFKKSCDFSKPISERMDKGWAL